MTKYVVAEIVQGICFFAVIGWILWGVYLVFWQAGVLLTPVVVGIAAGIVKDV